MVGGRLFLMLVVFLLLSCRLVVCVLLLLFIVMCGLFMVLLGSRV